MAFYTVTIFLSAFLLFEVQPIIAKMILPWFGGTSAVWSTCMLFFQAALLGGYLYADWLHRKLLPRVQAAVHIGALAISLAALPIVPNPRWRSVAAGQPSLRILALLALTVGLPYFLLSATSPLLQAWYARSHKQGLPYRLFALSNFASMLALISYPLLIEPNLPTGLQAWIWSGCYILFAVLCALTAWRAAATAVPGFANDPGAASRETAGDEPAWAVRLLWLGLAASASILLLAVTNHLTQDIAAIPFLWILPLSVYLLSFIFCFEAPRFYWRPLFLPLLAAALCFMAYELLPERPRIETRHQIMLYSLALFVCCMVCHGELARLKPHPRHLTVFYVLIALGGVVGGVFVGLVAPNLFRAYYEFPLGLGLCALVLAALYARLMIPWGRWWRAAAMAGLALAVGGYLWLLGNGMYQMVQGYMVVARNFYGQLRVWEIGDPNFDEYANRELIHGVINHGEQMLRDEYRRRPITYFCPQSGIGRAMKAQGGASRRIGVLGLGCGTLAAYGRPGDTIRIYEINPLVMQIANRDFTYLRDTPARVETVLGDGRLALESERTSQRFDVLVMDAFSGDSVPVHLITKEALKTYFFHLKPGGVLAINITNSYLDLQPVMERAAAAYDKVALVYHYDPADDDDDVLCFTCDWALIVDRATVEAHPELRRGATELHPGRPFRTWTDDFSNMYSVMR
jgi:hypothetical protein